MSTLPPQNLILPFDIPQPTQMAFTEQHKNLQREALENYYRGKQADIRRKENNLEKRLVYPNQQEAALEIQQAFLVENKICVTLIALPGAGKTGTFLGTAYNMCTIPDSNSIINSQNVFIITGMNDVDWQKQTMDAMIGPFAERVFHRGQFNRIREILLGTSIRDVLIIIDECHIGANKEHMLSSLLTDIGILNIEFLRSRNIRILEVSATPGHTLHDSKKWGVDNHKLITLKPSERYVGFKRFKEEGRLCNSIALDKPEKVEELCGIIERRWHTMPRWHCIRMGRKSSRILENIRESASRRGWDVIKHNSDDRIKDIDNKMKVAPPRHTFILIKDFWRAAKRLRYKFVGVVHEPETIVPDASVQAQALAARLCDNYTEEYDVNTAPLIFCTVSAINQYLNWIDNNGNYVGTDYHSANLNANRLSGTVVARDSFVSPSNVVGLERVVDNEQQTEAAARISRMKGMRVPRIIQVTPEEYARIPTGHDKEGKKAEIIALVELRDPALADELRRFKCEQITEPKLEDSDSYRKGILSLVDKSNKSALGMWWGITKAGNETGKAWAYFGDKFNHRLCFNIIGDRS